MRMSNQDDAAMEAQWAEAEDRITQLEARIVELEAKRNAMKPWAALGALYEAKSRENDCCDINGGTLQDAAIALGLLEYVTVDNPCGPDGYCYCEDYFGRDEWPVQCLRLSALGKEMP